MAFCYIHITVLHNPPHDKAAGEQEQFVLVHEKRLLCSENQTPCTGEVIGFGETYQQHNATLELQEKMGINVFEPQRSSCFDGNVTPTKMTWSNFGEIFTKRNIVEI